MKKIIFEETNPLIKQVNERIEKELKKQKLRLLFEYDGKIAKIHLNCRTEKNEIDLFDENDEDLEHDIVRYDFNVRNKNGETIFISTFSSYYINDDIQETRDLFMFTDRPNFTDFKYTGMKKSGPKWNSRVDIFLLDLLRDMNIISLIFQKNLDIKLIGENN